MQIRFIDSGRLRNIPLTVLGDIYRFLNEKPHFYDGTRFVSLDFAFFHQVISTVITLPMWDF